MGGLPDGNYLRIKYLTAQCNDVLIEGKERPIKRPQDTDRQKSCYSGKRKTHNVKNDLLCVAGYGLFRPYSEKCGCKNAGKEIQRQGFIRCSKGRKQKISSFRILVEHTIGGVKKCHIVKERFRCLKFGFDEFSHAYRLWSAEFQNINISGLYQYLWF